MPLLWLSFLGVLLTGYLLLDGYAFGVGLGLRRLGRDEGERRLLLNAVGPFFLGNEVWIVATAGVLLGGFPDLEGALLSGFSPLIVLVVGGLILRDAGMWFRSRRDTGRWRARWDRLITLASLALASGWGLILGNLVQEVPVGRAAPRGVELFGPYPLLCGVTFAALAAVHGAAFLAMRTQGALATRAARLAGRLIVPVAVLLVATVVVGFASAGAIEQPVTAALLALAALIPLLWARRFLARSSFGGALACTAAAVALPVSAVGVGLAPTVVGMSAAPGTLRLLVMFLIAALPVMAAGQIWLWRAFRGPVGPTSAMYF